tara:strand:+ start:332 stop:868 length:537 start_codon:yes stop_codon:yes gene_type:complete
MSTIALISIQQKDNIKSVYCNSDGYIEHCGILLNKYYNTFSKAEKLISLGSIFVLGEKIGYPHDIEIPFEHQFWHPKFEEKKPIPKTWSKFYYRDDVEIISNKGWNKKTTEKKEKYQNLNVEDFIVNTKNENELFETYNLESGVEYIYLFKRDTWFVKNNNVDTYNLLNENIKYLNTV